MATREIHMAKPVDLGRGWKATDLWITGGPIVLVQVTSKTEVRKSRLDTNKWMFIDPLPIEPDQRRVNELVDVVTAQSGAY